MKFNEEQIAKVRKACKIGKDSNIEQAIWDVVEELNEKREWQNEVAEWLELIDGEFNVTECFKELRAITTGEKQAVRVAISRFKADGIIEKIKGRMGGYRKKEGDLVEMHWQDAKPFPLVLDLPLELNTLFNAYKKNILLFSGTDDAGKTAITMDIIKQNQNNPYWADNIHMFNSEMSEEEANLRFTLHEKMEAADWRFKMYDRDANFGDVIVPDGLNIIDYLDLPGEAHNKLGDYIREIFNALNDGVCVIMLHKKHGATLGYGVELGLKIPRLYVTLESGTARIVKCKNRKTEHSCRGWVIYYNLVQGWKFVTKGIWHDPAGDPLEPKRTWEKR